MNVVRPISGPVGQAPARRRIPPRRLSIAATALLLGLFALVALKLWILARMLLAYLS
jgi:hypothetical protein